MPIKSVKNENFEKQKKNCFFLMSQGSLDPKIRFIGQKVCSVARVHTDTHTDRQTDMKVNTEDTLQGFRNFSFNLSSRIGPIICCISLSQPMVEADCKRERTKKMQRKNQNWMGSIDLNNP